MAEALAAPLTTPRAVTERAPTRAEVHARLAPYARANSFKGYASFAIDLALYAIGIAVVLLSAGWGGKLAGGVLAAIGVVNLGSL